MGDTVYFYLALLESFTVEYYVKMVAMQYAISDELRFDSVSNRVFLQNRDTKMCSADKFILYKSNSFPYERFCTGLVLKQSHEVTRKWPITVTFHDYQCTLYFKTWGNVTLLRFLSKTKPGIKDNAI